MRRRFLLPALLSLPLHAQYVGKVARVTAPPLRSVAVYEYTGEPTKPNASRLVPVVVWDGTNFQPGGLYKADPEPLAVAPGTQYVLTPGGMPGGLYNILSSSQLDGGWVGLGRYAAPPAAAPAKPLRRPKKLPVLHGGSANTTQPAESGPTLHRRTGSDDSTIGSSGQNGPVLHKRDDSAGSDSTSQSAGPTLHRRDTDTTGAADTGSGTANEDPDRPHLHEGTDSSTAQQQSSQDDGPLLHHGEAGAEGAPPPDAGRPRLRYGVAEDADTRVMPMLLQAAPKAPGAAPVTIGQMVAISDVTSDEAHPFAYAWPSAEARASAEEHMHALALRALANVATASFGPAAKGDAALKAAADAVDADLGAGTGSAPAAGSFGPAAPRHRKKAAAAQADPLVDADFRAFELSYGGGATLVYSAHTAPESAARRFVTVIAQLDFAGRPQKLFAQTTRGDMLAQTPALHLVDAVDAKGDHRAELLFDEQTSRNAGAPRDRQFALFSVFDGQADEVYSSGPGGVQ